MWNWLKNLWGGKTPASYTPTPSLGSTILSYPPAPAVPLYYVTVAAVCDSYGLNYKVFIAANAAAPQDNPNALAAALSSVANQPAMAGMVYVLTVKGIVPITQFLASIGYSVAQLKAPN